MALANAQPQIVHESEAQRQHVRVQFPAQAEIAGRGYQVKDLSSGGVGIEAYDQSARPGDMLDMTLVLPFGGFALDIAVKAQVQYLDAATRVLGCRFSELSPQQTSVLSHVIRAYMAGDIVAANDLLSVAGRDNFVKMRKGGAGAAVVQSKSFLATLGSYAIPAALGVGALLFVSLNVYEKAFVVKTSDAVITSQIRTIRATAEGTFKAQIGPQVETVANGQALAQLSGETTGTVALASPCDCVVAHRYAQDGEYVTAGTPLYALVPSDVPPKVEATVSVSDVQSVRLKSRALITIAGDKIEVSGTVTGIEYSQTFATSSAEAMLPPSAKVIIEPSRPLPPSMVGRPVKVSIVH